MSYVEREFIYAPFQNIYCRPFFELSHFRRKKFLFFSLLDLIEVECLLTLTVTLFSAKCSHFSKVISLYLARITRVNESAPMTYLTLAQAVNRKLGVLKVKSSLNKRNRRFHDEYNWTAACYMKKNILEI